MTFSSSVIASFSLVSIHKEEVPPSHRWYEVAMAAFLLEMMAMSPSVPSSARTMAMCSPSANEARGPSQVLDPLKAFQRGLQRGLPLI